MSTAPIFIVGCPRSGTTMLYDHMARHPDLAWISNVSKKAAGSLAVIRLLGFFLRDGHPTEAKKVWGRFDIADHHTLGRQDVTPAARRYFEKVVANHLRAAGKPRFLCKCPQNSLRIEFFDAIFPDAFFVHVVRDGRAVANSILRARKKHGGGYWGCRPPEWRSILEHPMLEASGLQWKTIVEHALRSGRALPPERYVEVRYEDLCDRPEETFLDVCSRVGLQWDPARVKGIMKDVKSRNYKWREAFTPAEIETLDSLLGDLLTKLGYELVPRK